MNKQIKNIISMVILMAGCLGLFLFSKQIKIDNQNDPVRNYVGQSKEIIQSQLNEKTEAVKKLKSELEQNPVRETEEKIHALEAEILDLEEEKYKVESNFYKNLHGGTDARINLVLKGICLVLMLMVAIWLKTKQKNRYEKMDMKILKTPKLKMEIPERKNKSDKK
jgi:lipoprotein